MAVQSLASTNSKLADAGSLQVAARVTNTRQRGQVDDLSPQMLVAINQTPPGCAGRRGIGTPRPAAALAHFSLALPLRARRLVGAVAGGRAGAGRGARSRRRGDSGPEVAQRPDPARTRTDASGARTRDRRMGRKLGGILMESVAVGENGARP